MTLVEGKSARLLASCVTLQALGCLLRILSIFSLLLIFVSFFQKKMLFTARCDRCNAIIFKISFKISHTPDPDGPLQKVVNLVVTLEKASADVSLK